MSGLYRSEDMTYVNCTMAGETAHATMKAITKLQCVHIMDLTPLAAVEAAAAASGEGQADDSRGISRKHFKQRFQAVTLLERKLEQFIDLRNRYRTLPAIPVPDGGEDNVAVHEMNGIDVVAACEEFFEPIERELGVNAEFETETRKALRSLLERKIVIEACAHLNMNDDLAELQRKHEAMSAEELHAFAEREESQRRSLSRRPPSANRPKKGGGGAELYSGIEMADMGNGRDEEEGAAGGLPPLVGGGGSGPSDGNGVLTRVDMSNFKMRNFYCGMLAVKDQMELMRGVFRLSRGNALLRFSEEVHQLYDPDTNQSVKKVVFYLIFLGMHLETRMQRLLDMLRATRYELPKVSELEEAMEAGLAKSGAAASDAAPAASPSDMGNGNGVNGHGHALSVKIDDEQKDGGGRPSPSPLARLSAAEIYAREIDYLNDEIAHKKAVVRETSRAVKNVLRGLFRAAEPDENGLVWSPLLDWKEALYQEKVLCAALMKAHFYRDLIAIEGWVPTSRIPLLREGVNQAVAGTGAPAAMLRYNPMQQLAPRSMPPTKFPSTRFTSTFQGIVDTYGTPRYKEVNPGLFTIISFPYLFAIMYGDIGHAVLLTLASLYLVLCERRLLQEQRRGEMNEIFSMVFEGRWVLLLMAIFAIYAGTIYNDIFSFNIRMYESGWMFDPADNTSEQMIPAERPYPYGLDPALHHAENGLLVYNSFKMKVSVIVGVIHMAFGITMSLLNHLYFKDWVSAIFEFIPRMVFLMSLFGYMDFMIIYKWCIDWSTTDQEPPNLVQTMIGMFLSPGSVSAKSQLYEGQSIVQAVLLLAAIASIPTMLCVKPCWNRYKHKKAHAHKLADLPAPDDMVNGTDDKSLLTAAVADPPTKPQRGSPMERQHSHSSKAPGSASNMSASRVSDEDSDEQKGTDPQDPVVRVHMKGLPGSPSVSAEPNGKAASPRKLGGIQVSLSSDDLATLEQVKHGEMSPNKAFAVDANEAIHAALAGVHGEYDFSDDMIHASIHTIEFVLGTVSNTASYLRLWALSLAHQELSLVFWDKLFMQYGIESTPGIAWIGYGAWCVATFCVLMCMDVLECFLHALRLHWVEFQNKFYYADGVAFEPLTFEKVDSK